MSKEDGGTFRMARRWMRENKGLREPSGPMPVQKMDPAALQVPLVDAGVQIYWLGHATALIAIDGHWVLTDPMFSARTSPFQWAGPKRFFESPVAVGDLPELSAVLISHDHYDHLDERSIQQLADTGVSFYVPLGVGAHLTRWNVPETQIVELDWWEDARIDDLRLVATPARHFSGRGAFDRNKTLWCSFAVVGNTHRVYFGGDSGVAEFFKEIGVRFGPFDVTLMPIGAYDPAWASIHLNPEEAVAAHRELRGDLLIPIHWGTFVLAIHGWTEPAERLVPAAQKAGVRVVVPKPGEIVTQAETPELEMWWRQVGATGKSEARASLFPWPQQADSDGTPS